MRKWLPAISGVALAIYPLAVIVGIRFLDVATLWMVLFSLLALRLLASRWFHEQTLMLQGSLLVMLGSLLLLPLFLDLDFMLGIRFYPVVVSAAVFSMFFFSLFTAQPLVERFARLREGDLPPEGIRYTRLATLAWSVFLFCNGFIALMTALWAPDWLWGLYNGLVSYCLIALMFAAEYTVRQRARRRWMAP